ncbi:MAG: 4-fold beta flower protein [Chloroflexota bacterium]
MENHKTIIPIYTSRGDAEAFLAYPYLYNRMGEWIGWVNAKREVYSVLGIYVGYLSPEPRILRKRATSTLKARQAPPQKPEKVYPPATVPLAPMMKELTISTMDVLLDEPERLHTLDAGELREDIV